MAPRKEKSLVVKATIPTTFPLHTFLAGVPEGQRAKQLLMLATLGLNMGGQVSAEGPRTTSTQVRPGGPTLGKTSGTAQPTVATASALSGSFIDSVAGGG